MRRPQFHRLFALLSVLLLVALLVAACGEEDAENGNGTGADPTATPPPATPTPVPPIELRRSWVQKIRQLLEGGE